MQDKSSAAKTVYLEEEELDKIREEKEKKDVDALPDYMPRYYMKKYCKPSLKMPACLPVCLFVYHLIIKVH